MTLNHSSGIPYMRQYQISVDAAPCPPHRHYGCRHPPPSAHANLFVERMSEGLIAALRSGLLKIGSMWLYVTPAPRAVTPGVRPACFPGGTGWRLKPSSCPHALFKGFEYQEVKSLEGGFAYAKHDCCHPSSRGVEEWK